MNKYEMFDLMSGNKDFIIEYEGNKLTKKTEGNSVVYYDDETDEPMITVSGGKVYCTACDCPFGKNNIEGVNDHTIKLICPDCLYEYKVVFVRVNQVPMSNDVKVLMDDSMYIAKVGDRTIHVLYTDGIFYSIEDNGVVVKPDLIVKEEFLTNLQIANLKDSMKEEQK